MAANGGQAAASTIQGCRSCGRFQPCVGNDEVNRLADDSRSDCFQKGGVEFRVVGLG
jgi:hypothetical protein